HCSLYRSHHHPDLPSFPTRRSSDLGKVRLPACRATLCQQKLRLQRLHRFAVRSLFSSSASCAGLRWVFGNDRSTSSCSRHTAERSEEHTSELQSRGHLVCRLLLEKK